MKRTHDNDWIAIAFNLYLRCKVLSSPKEYPSQREVFYALMKVSESRNRKLSFRNLGPPLSYLSIVS